MQYEIQLSNSI